MSVTSAIDNLKDEMQKAGIKSENGLGTELFLFSSTLIPVVNVDLLLTNSKHEILLAWRDDPHTGKGWHIPGGCVRFKEAHGLRAKNRDYGIWCGGYLSS